MNFLVHLSWLQKIKLSNHVTLELSPSYSSLKLNNCSQEASTVNFGVLNALCELSIYRERL